MIVPAPASADPCRSDGSLIAVADATLGGRVEMAWRRAAIGGTLVRATTATQADSALGHTAGAPPRLALIDMDFPENPASRG